MKKLGICVCYQHRNYGSQLQSYATTAELKRRGIDFEIIRYQKKITPSLLFKFIPNLLDPVFINDRIIENYQKKLVLKLHPALKQNNDIRNKAFDSFSKTRFQNLSPVYYGYQELREQARKYTAVMVGSDQLWSPSGINSDFYNLMFAPDGAVKISYAASFGVSQIKPKYKKKYTTFLNRLQYISVRENSGKQIVESLSSNKAEVTVDPVLLLDAQQWLEEIPDKRLYNEPYIFAYFLGKTPEYREAVNKFAKKKGLKIVSEPHMDTYNKADKNFGDYNPYNVGPAEFVNLIRHAEYIFTDSFHGSVFSMLYKKKFMIFNRYSQDSATSKNSRIDSFCTNYMLEDRRYSNDIFAVDRKIDYDCVLEKVNEHRQKSLKFLDAARSDFV